MKITLTNDFHNTEATLRVKRGDFTNEHGAAGYTASARQAKQVRGQLCGHRGCACSSSPLGNRGPQAQAIVVVSNYDGGADVYA